MLSPAPFSCPNKRSSATARTTSSLGPRFLCSRALCSFLSAVYSLQYTAFNDLKIGYSPQFFCHNSTSCCARFCAT